MRAALDVMFDPDDVIELRALHKRRKRVDAGYFDGAHRDALVDEAARLNAAAAGVYVTLNCIDPQLLGRCCNRVEDYASATVTDANVIRRRWFMTDWDPVRPKNTSATAAQVEEAKTCAAICCQALKSEGWPTPVTAESGNGVHLYFPIDLPNDLETESLIQSALAGVAARFDTEAVKCDQSVFNAGRITKLCGTVATKGDHTRNMPWRLSRMVSGADRDVVVTADQLRALHLKGNGADPKAGSAFGGGRFDLSEFLSRLGIPYDQDVHDGSERYKLEHCPFYSEHGKGEAAIGRRLDNGALWFRCQHSSCAGKKWKDVRALVDDQKKTRSSKAGARASAKPDTGAAPEEAQEPPATIVEVVETFQRWLYLPDEGMVYVPLGAVAANYFESDPVWLLTVGAPSGGKTEVIIASAGLPNVHMAATLTEAALLSGTPAKQSLGKGGLLKEIGGFGILALKDFTSVLSMNRDQRAQLLAALREIYDGSWTRRLGVDGGRKLPWTGKLGLIAGCTATIDSHHAVMSVMGERFLLYRLPTIDPAKQAEKALSNTGQVGVMRKELSAIVRRLFAGLDISKGLPPIDDADTKKLVALSSLVASARSAIERNPYGAREIDLVLDTELPARLAQALRRLFAGMLALGLDRETAWPLVAKTGLDSIPKIRRAAFDILLAAPDWMPTAEIAVKALHPTTTTRRALEDLHAHGVVDRQPAAKGKGDGQPGTKGKGKGEPGAKAKGAEQPGGKGKGAGRSDLWQVSASARAMYKAIVPEMSVDVEEEPSSPSISSSLKNTLHAHTYFSGTKAEAASETASECGSQGSPEGDPEGDFEGDPESGDRHCWRCKGPIDDDDADRCPSCEWFICSCGACSRECSRGDGGDLMDGAV